MKRISFIIILSFLIPSLGFAQGNLSAQQALAKGVDNITSARGISANFKVYNSGYSGSGTVKMSGKKFIVTLPDVEVWYNGKDLYTYNKRSGETTVVIPSAEELAQSNPLAYISNAKNTYNVAFSTVKKNGRYVLELTPKVKGGDVKRITLTLKNNDFAPEKIVVEPSSGTPISADITYFKTGVSIAPSEFEYPKSKYPKIEIVDLR